MERGFLSQKGSEGGRGVKEKDKVADVVSLVVTDELVVKDKQDTSVDTCIPNVENTGLNSVPSKKAMNIRTLFTPGGTLWWNPDVDLLKEDVRNVPVWVKLHGVPVTTFSEDGLSAIAMKLGTSLMLDSYTSDMCLQSWGRSSYARVMIELRADVELKENIVVAMLKIMRKEYYTCTVRVKYELKPHRSLVKLLEVFRWPNDFKPHKEYRPVPKKPTASPSGNKKKGVAHTNEVSNSNPFNVLNSVDNDVKLGTNGGTTNLVNNEANSSGSSFMNFENSSTSNTSIIDKIGKFEDLLIDGQAIFVDEAGNPLKKVESLSDYDSEDEVASVDNDITRSLALEKVGFGTQSLLEQWRDLMVMVTMMKTHTMMICMKARIFLKRFKLYAIILISEFEVARRNRFMFLLSSHFVYLPLRK
ncbi:proteasome subunit alpha type-5 [Tanacetum coccineum]